MLLCKNSHVGYFVSVIMKISQSYSCNNALFHYYINAKAYYYASMQDTEYMINTNVEYITKRYDD